ncbi:hypothetical protein BDZ94DRAFT_1260867 [Collybia nuda]|uniref:Uncharacterized protein n=1 Tax=Collybia nuda TaxID=64659 RepID=A0A9P6CJ84_9AGAR|nr:hypothetical protein BDZ94DRAFT_1260867 [Collybia nuda]
MRLRNSITTGREVQKDIPAPAETVLNRPDPTEKPVPSPDHHSSVRVYSISSNTTIDLDPESQHSSHHTSYNPSRRPTTNPFDDSTSIQTAGTEGTNVIPIALVSPDSHRPFSPASETNTQLSTTSTFPVRPARSPELNLNLDHVNISRDSVRGTNLAYALSQRSGISGVSSRNSYMSNASYSSDFLNEAPMIITPTKGAVRQVLGVVKAEMINAPGSSHASDSHASDSLKPPSSARPSVGSPLASTSFGPADLVKEGDGNQALANPFSDEASIDVNYSASPAASATTFGHSSTGAVRDSHSEWIVDTPTLPWAQSRDQSRPSSMSTQAGSVIDIGSATRVNVGLKGLSGNYALASSQLSPYSTPRSPYRTTMGRLVSPSITGSGTLEEQQQVALAHAQAQTHGMELNRRISISSAMSATSTRADSILESFPFVPPSPISNRPVRSPPVSPLSQQAFNGGPPSPLGQQHIINVAPPSPLAHQTFTNDGSTVADTPLPDPPSRRTLGLSTASQFSTASSGLGSFPFQIDSGTSTESGAAPPSAFNGRQRASLDTLALTSDLSSYPLGFDNDSVQVPQIPHKS